MKFLILMGSPRLHGNTAELCKPFIHTLEEAGAAVRVITIADKKIAPCKGCYVCQSVSGEYGCSQKDDMQLIVDGIVWCNTIVFATPIYTWYCPGEMKSMLDRLYGMNKYYGEGSGSLWDGKEVAILATHGYDREYAVTPFELGIKSLCEHSHLTYRGLYSARDLDHLASFQTEEVIQEARAFAKSLLPNFLLVNRNEYPILKLLGKGKGGYSYLVTDASKYLVLKQLHHEPCSYYTFGNKLEAEQKDYQRLKAIGIPMPELRSIDEDHERILKEYIDGPTIFDLVKEDKMNDDYIEQVRNIAELAKSNGINIDYFPTNFVVQNELLYYIDYECNDYMEEWDFDHWGIQYWSKTEEFLQYLNNATPMTAADYDQSIAKTVPYYDEFYEQAIDLVKTLHYNNANWLDTGCGTGELVVRAAKQFPDYQFDLCDPSGGMLAYASNKLSCCKQVHSIELKSSGQINDNDRYQIVTAIQCHHYLQEEERAQATKKCYDALTKGGIYITFENYAPGDATAKGIALTRWEAYQEEHGKSKEEASAHIDRYGTKYFPITIVEHLNLLRDTGFETVEILWVSYMQVGIYAIK